MAANHVDGDDISILNIHDNTLTGDVHAVFSPRNNFLVYGVQRGKIRKTWDKQYLHEINSKVSLFSKYIRKLVNESHSIFLSLNTRIKDIRDGRKNFEISKISQMYRSVLLVCIDELSKTDEANADEDLEELKTMLADIELIWHLLHCLIIDCQSGSKVLYQLLDWIQWHFTLAEEKMEEITASEEASAHCEYWDTIIQFVLQGKMELATSLLAMHSKFEREDFKSLNDLLLKMPKYNSTSKMSLNEFRIRWRHWQEECKGRLHRGEFASELNLETVCKVLCGDTDILTQKSYLCCNWYHLMITFQLYTDPTISLSALGDVARLFYNNVDRTEWRTTACVVDSIILAAMELDIMNVINLSCTFNDGWWFAVHMMDLLIHGNYIDQDPQQNYPHHYRSHLLMNYADALMSHTSLWEIGISYLDQCQDSGRELLEHYLERIPLKTEAKARKIIHIAKQRNMENLVKTISNVMMSKAMANGKLGTAMSWIMYSKDVKFADELADRWMKDYADKRKFECFEILHNMGSCMLVSDKLTFVGKYCEFHKLYSEREYKNAAALLVSLISSGIAPSNFQMIMLLDALPLLESSELIFSSKDTHQLMKCLEETVFSNGKKANEPHESDDKESLIRLALIRNLARSFVLEPSDIDSEIGF